ncbi:site-specific integrase [Donghicola tyrosinivorans]|uniref:Phage integrase family protein n=1 Tax=Donghicola tyrosinivorans TaxID=1652492 RepID=A0A2T0X604_9RHOB|nr:site-specific integrase [Donghicola tyrosinivorans]PRY94304.1 hypothetical protein CLV74_101441 [Donghicola tyrosinivorans]
MQNPRITVRKEKFDLPDRSFTRDGVEFSPRENVWRISGLSRQQSFDYKKLLRLSATLDLKLRKFFIIALKNYSFTHACNLFSTFQRFLDCIADPNIPCISQIELHHIFSYKVTLDNKTEWKLGVLRILLVEMDNLGFGITSREAIDYLKSSKIRGNIKGTSIRTRDPNAGAFSDLELYAIQSDLNAAYADGKIDLYRFAISWLLLAYGIRPIQIAALKEKDLVVSEGSEGATYAIRIPRAKQRGVGHRDLFTSRYCSKQVGQLLENVIKSNADKRTAYELSAGEAPLFIADEIGVLPDFPFHMAAKKVGVLINNTIGKVSKLKGNSRRFRITLAQRAVDDSKDKWTVAELLDHSDTQNVEVYYEASPSMVLRLDRHLAMELAPLAQAFAGVVVQTEAEAQRGEDRSSRIYDRSLIDNINDRLGNCGQMSFCGLAAPFACYTCRHFQPWTDGPHEAFMEAMIADRKRLEDNGISAKIYSIRDRAILAAAEIIQLCDAAKLSGGIDN